MTPDCRLTKQQGNLSVQDRTLALQSGDAQENGANGLRLLAGWGQRRIKRN